MSEPTEAPTTTIPADDPARRMVNAAPADPEVSCIALAGGIYAIVVTGEETRGRYTLIDMQIPPGGGPPPHRHDFEEMFTILAGEIEFTFRGEKIVVGAGRTVNIPANAPHNFRNVSDVTAHMLCMCAPAMQDEYFLQVGDRVDGPSAKPPKLDDAAIAERRKRATDLAPRYRTVFL